MEEPDVHAMVTRRLAELASSPPGLNSAEACDVLARSYPPGVEPQLVIGTGDRDAFERVVADRYWHLRLSGNPRVVTAVDCGGWVARWVRPDLQQEVSEQWALGFGFVCRDRVETLQETVITARDVPHGDAGAFGLLFHAGKLRANFAFAELYAVLNPQFPLAAAAGPRYESAVVHALRAFAAFGSRAYTAEHAIEEFEQAWSARDRGRAAVDVALNGLAVSAPFAGQGQMLDRYAAEAVGLYPRDHAMRYRLAIGRTLIGDYSGALTAIDEALEHLPAHGWRGSHGLLIDQYIGQRLEILRRLHR